VKVLVTTTPGAGHVNPVVPVAAALRDAGHDVTWASAADARARIESFGFCHARAGLDGATRFRLLHEQHPELWELAPRDRRRVAVTMFSRIAAPAMQRDLEPLMDAVRPDLVVHEPLEWAGPAAAAARDVPHVTVGFGGFPPEGLVAQEASALAGLWGALGLAPPAAGGLYDHLYLHPFPPSLGPPAPAPTVRALRPVGFDGTLDPPEPEWLAPLGRERPFVYVTFGTEHARPDALRAVLDAFADLDADGLLTTGPQVDPGSLGPAPAHLRVERYVPQRLVLTRATAFVSHAGSGALLGAAAVGLPMLSLPNTADQFPNADALVAAGAGITLEPDAVDAPALGAGIRQLLTDPALAAGARMLAAEIAVMPEPADHVDALTALAGVPGRRG
jgi:UDP:flavonoid glycosyltransferase YjiC (YdhE family)